MLRSTVRSSCWQRQVLTCPCSFMRSCSPGGVPQRTARCSDWGFCDNWQSSPGFLLRGCGEDQLMPDTPELSVRRLGIESLIGCRTPPQSSTRLSSPMPRPHSFTVSSGEIRFQGTVVETCVQRSTRTTFSSVSVVSCGLCSKYESFISCGGMHRRSLRFRGGFLLQFPLLMTRKVRSMFISPRSSVSSGCMCINMHSGTTRQELQGRACV